MSDFEENGAVEKNNSGFWLGAVLGGVIGAAVAYLAVDDKSQLRKNLIKKGKVLLNYLDDLKDDAADKGKEIQKEAVKKFEDVKENIQDKVEELPDITQEAVEKVQEEANRAITQIVKTADNAEVQVHKQARKFFLSKGKPLVKK